MSAEINSVAVIPGEYEDEVWIAVTRNLPGASPTCYVERMASRYFSTQDTAFHVDCGYWYDSTPVSSITGLTWLEGQEVAVLADGVTIENKTVSSGAIALGVTASKVVVGLPNQFLVEPMRLDMPGSANRGSYIGVKELVLSFLNTGAAQYGLDTSDLYDVQLNRPGMTTVPLLTGDVTVTLPGGFDPDTHFVVTGETAQPCTLRCIVARAQVTGR